MAPRRASLRKKSINMLTLEMSYCGGGGPRAVLMNQHPPAARHLHRHVAQAEAVALHDHARRPSVLGGPFHPVAGTEPA